MARIVCKCSNTQIGKCADLGGVAADIAFFEAGVLCFICQAGIVEKRTRIRACLRSAPQNSHFRGARWRRFIEVSEMHGAAVAACVPSRWLSVRRSWAHAADLIRGLAILRQ